MSPKSRWVRAVRCNDIPPREGRSVRLAGREIAIFNLGGRFVAIDNRCPHKGGPLAEGIVAGGTVVCPLHAWKVNLETGTIARPTGDASCVQTFPVRVIEEVIQVGLPLRTTEQRESPMSCTEQNSPASWPIDAGSIGELAP